jgi:hypothetical protein
MVTVYGAAASSVAPPITLLSAIWKLRAVVTLLLFVTLTVMLRSPVSPLAQPSVPLEAVKSVPAIAVPFAVA